jgi:hypothetical protein
MESGRLWTASTLVGLLSWSGVAYVVTSTDPALTANRVAFLGLLFLGLVCVLSPVAHFLHFRFAAAKSYRSNARRSFREGGLAALFVMLCAWLRMGQALNWINALLLLSTLTLVEVFLLVKSS